MESADLAEAKTDWRIGGIEGGRALDITDLFEIGVFYASIVAGIRQDRQVAEDFWSALTNTVWRGRDGALVGCTYRYAGDVIAGARNDGTDYLDWYCCGPSGVVKPYVAEAMAREGWTPNKAPEAAQ